LSERQEPTPLDPAEEAVEAVDAIPVLGDVRTLEPVPERGMALAIRTPAQAVAVAVTGFIAGAATIALVHRRRTRRALGSSSRRRRGRGRGELISVAGTRSFLVDVHLLNR